MEKNRAFSVEEIASYLAGRLERRRKGVGGKAAALRPPGRQGGRAAGRIKAPRDGATAAVVADRLAGLVLEKQDLNRQVIADERACAGKERSIGQGALLAAIGAPEGADLKGADLKALVARIGISQGVETRLKGRKSGWPISTGRRPRCWPTRR